MYGAWILDKISFIFRQKPHCSVKYKKVLNKTEALRKSNIPRSITFSDKSVPFCHTLHIHKDQTKNNDFPMFSTPNINILIRYVVILLLHERVCNTLMRDQWFNQFFDSCINAWAMFMTTFCITQNIYSDRKGSILPQNILVFNVFILCQNTRKGERWSVD